MIEEPKAYSAHELRAQFTNMSTQKHVIAQPGNVDVWIPARSMTLKRFALWKRFKLALAVFLGRADAVYWDRIFYNSKERFK